MYPLNLADLMLLLEPNAPAPKFIEILNPDKLPRLKLVTAPLLFVMLRVGLENKLKFILVLLRATMPLLANIPQSPPPQPPVPPSG